MMLAAHAVGVATCWINREIEMFATEEGKTIMKEMGLPDGLGGIGALAVGYADAEPAEPKPRKEDTRASSADLRLITSSPYSLPLRSF